MGKNPLDIPTIHIDESWVTLSKVAEYTYSKPFNDDKVYTKNEAYFQAQENPTQLLAITDGHIINFKFE